MGVNAAQIHALASQIRHTTDPETMTLIAAEHLKGLLGVQKSSTTQQAAIAAQFMPIMSLPSPTPTSIISWLGKLVTATAAPQIKAYAQYTSTLIEYARALQDLSSAINDAKNNLGNFDDAIVSKVEQMKDEITAPIDAALANVKAQQDAINQLVSSPIANFDTSSPDAFLGSVVTSLESFDQKVSTVLNAVEE